MDVAYRLSWGNVYQEIENMCMSNSLIQVGKVIAEKLDQAMGDWLDPDACVSDEDEQETFEAESTAFVDTLNESSENALPVAEPLAGCQNDSLSDDEALKSASDQINSIQELASYISPTGTCENSLPVAEPLAGCQNDSLSDDEALKSASDQINSIQELASYISPTGTCDAKESTTTLQDFTTHMEENECEQQIEDIKSLVSEQDREIGVSESSHREDMSNNMHVLDLKSEDLQDVDLHDSWEDDDEDYDLVLASYREPRKMSYKKKIIASFISKLRVLSHYKKKAGTSCRDLNVQRQRARGVRSSSDSEKGSNHDLESSEWEFL
ncbi:hypothetical protein MUK42_30926 [Musa troglodytarum]|uniref:Uncharacterized protein n=1 Tax=Musa troglodytarum TaxID=320322 RepID=A0A9E7JV90_9LILI|nr:hypothetical protein MUK42_30926 [Musa troglodytarum]